MIWLLLTFAWLFVALPASAASSGAAEGIDWLVELEVMGAWFFRIVVALIIGFGLPLTIRAYVHRPGWLQELLIEHADEVAEAMARARSMFRSGAPDLGAWVFLAAVVASNAAVFFAALWFGSAVLARL